MDEPDLIRVIRFVCRSGRSLYGAPDDLNGYEYRVVWEIRDSGDSCCQVDLIEMTPDEYYKLPAADLIK